MPFANWRLKSAPGSLDIAGIVTYDASAARVIRPISKRHRMASNRFIKRRVPAKRLSISPRLITRRASGAAGALRRHFILQWHALTNK